MEPTAAEKRQALKKMLDEPTCHIAPSCNDGIQARLVEWLGFPLVHISGSGQHRSLGFADAGLLTLTEMVNKAREIVDAVNIPIVSDCETGYGNAVNVTRAVREFEKAGVAALHIEDQMTPKRAGHEGFDVGLVSREEFVNKIKAALDIRRDQNLVIIARSEAKDSLQERIDRVSACCEAGADALWLERSHRGRNQSVRKNRQADGRCAPASNHAAFALGRVGRSRWLHPNGFASRRAARHAPVFGGIAKERHRSRLLQANPWH